MTSYSKIKMTNCENVRLESNVNDNPRTHTMVFLIIHGSNNGTERKRKKSGLVRISNEQNFDEQVKQMKKDFKFLLPIQSQTEESVRAALNFDEKPFCEFNDIDKCKAFLGRRPNNSVTLLISNSCAQRAEIISEFEKLPQIIRLYICVSKERFDAWFERRAFESNIQSFSQLPLVTTDTPIRYMDIGIQHAFAYLFITKFTQEISPSDDAIVIFISFCKLECRKYSNDLKYEEHIEQFEREYNSSKALEWYTKPKTFIYRMITETCISLNYEVLAKIGFLLRDIYAHLRDLYKKQLGIRLKPGLNVFRGCVMPVDELNDLKTKGNIFVTRNLVSASANRNVAEMYYHNGKENTHSGECVEVTFQLDYLELDEKPIAFVDEVSEFPEEKELLFPMGIVFRVQSCKRRKRNDKYLWRIKMIRGEEEVRIEKDLSRYSEWLETVERGILTITDIVTQLSPSTEGASQPVPQVNPASQTTQPNTQIQNGHATIEMHGIEQIPSDVATTVNNLATTIASAASLEDKIINIVLVVITVVNILGAITVGIALPIAAKMNSTAIDSPICSVFTAVLNPSSNYQVEQLNINCFQTLVNMTILQIIQRTYNETYAQQYQTFWNQSTNMTYTETPTQLTYFWYSLPGMLLVKESFPHFVEAQYYYTPGSVRITSGDTWQISMETINGKRQYLTGTF